MTRPIPADTRGIIDPVAMMRYVDFARFSPGDALDGLIEWFWAVEWDLPQGFLHDQQVLNHPAGNISIGTLDDAGVPLDRAEGCVYGVMTGLSHRHLTGSGWTVAARTTVGGIGALLNVPAKPVVDTQLTFEAALPDFDGPLVVEDVLAETTNASRVRSLRKALTGLVEHRDPSLVAEARNVAAIAAIAETDRSIRRVEQLASLAGVSARTLQRLFDFHIGVTPSFVIRDGGSSRRQSRLVVRSTTTANGVDGPTWLPNSATPTTPISPATSASTSEHPPPPTWRRPRSHTAEQRTPPQPDQNPSGPRRTRQTGRQAPNGASTITGSASRNS